MLIGAHQELAFVQGAHVSWLWLSRTLLREYVIISIFRVINLLSTKYMAANTRETRLYRHYAINIASYWSGNETSSTHLGRKNKQTNKQTNKDACVS